MSGGVERANWELLQRRRGSGASSPLLGALAAEAAEGEGVQNTDHLPGKNKDEAIDQSIRSLLATGALSGSSPDRRHLPHHNPGDPVNFIG
jgi:hypothetical protein